MGTPQLSIPHSLTVFVQAYYVVLAQCNNPLITFGLSLFAPSLPLYQNTILTHLSLSVLELCLVRHSLVSVQFVRVLRLVRCDTTQCGFDSRSRLHRSDQSPISLHPLFSSIEEMSYSGQTQTKESLHFKDRVVICFCQFFRPSGEIIM